MKDYIRRVNAFLIKRNVLPFKPCEHCKRDCKYEDVTFCSIFASDFPHHTNHHKRRDLDL